MVKMTRKNCAFFPVNTGGAKTKHDLSCFFLIKFNFPPQFFVCASHSSQILRSDDSAQTINF